jgi:2-methylisocitrate lyase-like PEP mutase family enzyme
MNHGATLKKRLSQKEIIIAPGIYDALTASLVEKAGFEAAFLSGASIAYTRFGRPDIGLVSMSEVAEVVANIRERVEIPVIADGDTGFGNALNVQRTIRVFEQMGASCIQLEDQTLPKRCGHLKGKTLVSPAEMVGKVKAAVDARKSEDTLIMARTDAIAVEGFEAAVDRANRYVEAGCDILFVEAVRTKEQMLEVTKTFGDRVPLLSNMVEGGKTPFLPAKELEEIGYSIVIFPGGFVRALTFMAREYFSSLAENGTTEPYRVRMLDLQGINDLLGTEGILAAGGKYDAKNFEK